MATNQSIKGLFFYKTKIDQSISTQNPNSAVPFDTVERHVYFSYGDSDVQLFLYRTNDNVSQRIKYYKAMEEAFRLLLAFKPLTTSILISASSFVQSDLTKDLFLNFIDFGNLEDPHICLIRKESTWADFITKWQNQAADLSELARFSLYYDKGILNTLSLFPARSKSGQTGIQCSQIWARESVDILESIQNTPTMKESDLVELGQEILDQSIFVWENLRKSLCKYGVNFPMWQNQLLYALIRAYLQISSLDMALPSGIAIDWDFWPYESRSYYTNLRLLRTVVNICSVKKDFLSIDPKQLYHLISNEDFLAFKWAIANQLTHKDIISTALNQKKHFIAALKSCHY